MENEVLKTDDRTRNELESENLSGLMKYMANYRAKIMEVKGNEVDVEFVDYGNCQTVSWRNLRDVAVVGP